MTSISIPYRFTALVFAVLFLVATNVRADLISGDLLFTTDRDTYLGGVHGSDWIFSGIKEHTGGKGGNPWTQWTYNITSTLENTTTGAIYSNNFNGNGASGAGTGEAGVSVIGTGYMSHNSANNFKMSFDDPFVNSFYINLTPWSSYSAADAFDLTILYWDSDSVLQTVTIKQTFTDTTPFLGINLDNGAYLASVFFASIGTGNNGYLIAGMGFGDNGFYDHNPDIDHPPTDGGSVTVTPEPATMLVIGLGLAGLGLAARRKRK